MIHFPFYCRHVNRHSPTPPPPPSPLESVFHHFSLKYKPPPAPTSLLYPPYHPTAYNFSTIPPHVLTFSLSLSCSFSFPSNKLLHCVVYLLLLILHPNGRRRASSVGESPQRTSLFCHNGPVPPNYLQWDHTPCTHITTLMKIITSLPTLFVVYFILGIQTLPPTSSPPFVQVA